MKKVIGLLIILGSICWSLTMVKSGMRHDYGLGFWGANGHDGIWHIALSSSLSKFSFENPVFAGENIKNYHIGFDVILAMIHVITGIRLHTLYFQILPPLFALGIGLLVYWFIWNWRKSIKEAIWAIFFTYFSGSAAWVLSRGESAFWSSQAISTLVNPPFALSLIFILLGLISLLKKKKLLAVLCFGVLIQIKAYAGILVLGALLISGNFSVFFGSLLLSMLLFLPFNKEAVSVIKWEPFWFFETMMNYSDRLGWQKFYSAMTTYKMGHVWFKEIVAYGAAFAIFIIGNFWTRLLFLKDIFKKLDSIKIMLLTIIAAGVIIPMFFVQSGTPWNTIQFMYYSLFFSGILAGIVLSHATYLILLATILLTIPTTIITLKDVYIPSRPPAMLSNSEIEALDFLKKQPSGTILTYPFDKLKADGAISNPPRPLYLYESTAYVSAFSGKQTFLEDEVNLNIMGYDWQGRRKQVESFFTNPNEEFLKINDIKYIYLVGYQRETQLGILSETEKIFENKEVQIYNTSY